jgi:putative two-component system protein, hydrogenase maturation factor HypX/HoxX
MHFAKRFDEAQNPGPNSATANLAEFAAFVESYAESLAGSENFEALLTHKRRLRENDERIRPLDSYREEELAHMKMNFYGFDPSYHVARDRFVHRTPHAWTPLHLAWHRRAARRVPDVCGIA